MTNKKSNPVMSPEWLDSLLSADVVPSPPIPENVEGLPMPDGSVAKPIRPDWRQEPVLLSLAVLLQSLGRGNFEQARQETQTINRCLAVGASPDPVLLARMLRDLIG